MRVGTVVMGGIASIALAGCGNGAAEQAAQEVYDACHKPGADIDMFRLDGDTVHLELTGSGARDFAEMMDKDVDVNNLDALLEGDGFALAAGLVIHTDCLVEQTDFPGTAEQLADGDEWTGWRYTEVSGPGAEFRRSFQATG